LSLLARNFVNIFWTIAFLCCGLQLGTCHFGAYWPTLPHTVFGRVEREAMCACVVAIIFR